MNFREITVPNVAMGALERKIKDSAMGLYLFGTSSPMAVPNDSCIASPSPKIAAPMINPFTSGVNEQRIMPISATPFPTMKNHRRPNKSLNRPMTKSDGPQGQHIFQTKRNNWRLGETIGRHCVCKKLLRPSRYVPV